MNNYRTIIERLSKKGSVFGLDTMRNLLDLLGHPEEALHIIHIAGTNGKGSTFAFLSGILMESGYRVGRYISPTIECYEERFQINGSFIPQDRLEIYFEKMEQICRIMEERGLNTPTIFEVETAISLLYFKDESVDFALVETGMGGLMDATNAIENQIMSVIVSISEDHKAILGNTLKEIAFQKAGIIKWGKPVILADNPEEVKDVVREQCALKEAVLVEMDRSDYNILDDGATGSTFLWKESLYKIALPGAHQVDNAVAALAAADYLRTMKCGEKITLESMKNGLERSRWPGRLELISQNPPFYMDGAHNPDGARKLADFLEKHFTNKRIVYIMGVLGDKEYPRMLSDLMPLAHAAYVFRPNNARGLAAELLAQAMEPYGVPVTVCENVVEAVDRAKKEMTDADCFMLCGSLSFMEEIRSHL